MMEEVLTDKLQQNHEFHEDMLAAVDLFPEEDEDYLTDDFFEAMIEQESHREFLIENDIVQSRDDNDGYSWSDFDRVKDVVYGTPINVPEVDTEPYSSLARGVLIGVVLLAPGLRFGPLRDIVASVIDVALGPIVSMSSFLVVMSLIAIGTSMFATVIRSRVRDMDKIEGLRERLDMMQTERYRLLQLGEEEAAKEYRNKMVFEEKVQFQLVREVFRETPWIIAVGLPLFIWMIWMVNDVGVAGTIPFPIISSVEYGHLYYSLLPAWIVWYFVVSIITSQTLSLSTKLIK